MYYRIGGKTPIHYKKKTGSFEDCSRCCLQLHTILRWAYTWLPSSTSEPEQREAYLTCGCQGPIHKRIDSQGIGWVR